MKSCKLTRVSLLGYARKFEELRGEGVGLGLVEVVEAELAAGGICIFAAGAAEHGLDAVFHEDIKEHEKGFFGGGLEVGSVVDGRERDEIDLGHGDAADLLSEFFGAGAGIIDAADEGIFKRDDAFGFVGVVGASGEEFIDGPFAVDGHELGAEGVVGCVEGDGEFELDPFRGKASEAWDDAAGRESDVACAEVGSFA